MGENSVEGKLSREVLIPQKPSSGVGVMVVAATAMFFAVASSAFVLRARMAHRSCTSYGAGHTVKLVTPTNPIRPAATPATVPNAECGKALYGTDKNGKASVYFTVCPPSSNKAGFVHVDKNAPKVRRVVDGIQVHRVVR